MIVLVKEVNCELAGVNKAVYRASEQIVRSVQVQLASGPQFVVGLP